MMYINKICHLSMWLSNPTSNLKGASTPENEHAIPIHSPQKKGQA